METITATDVRTTGPVRNWTGGGYGADGARARQGRADAEALARALGWFSVGLGVAELVAPESVARLIGVRPTRRRMTTLRAMGLREIAAGAGILADPSRPGPVWARVAGDALDLALLGRAMDAPDAREERTVAATLAVLGVTALDIRCARQLSRPEENVESTEEGPGILVKRSITVNRPVEEVYGFWHDFENLPRFMRHLESVTVVGGGRSRWKAKAPAGQSVEWDAETTEDVPNQRIAWRSLEGADVTNHGRVDFRPAPGGRGTELRVELRYDPPGGKVTAALARLFREEPGQQVRDDLLAFKQVMETGEVTVSDATVDRGPHPAQPSER